MRAENKGRKEERGDQKERLYIYIYIYIYKGEEKRPNGELKKDKEQRG